MIGAGFLALLCRPDNLAAGEQAQAYRRRLATLGPWSLAAQDDRVAIWTDRASNLPVTALGTSGWCVGMRYAKSGGPVRDRPAAIAMDDPSPSRTAKQLCAETWGRYVALLHAAEGETAIFRDPSGQLECLVWTLASGITVVASSLSAAPAWVRPRHMALNWDRVSVYVGMLSAASTEPLLDGLEAVGPGELVRPDRGRLARELIWRPADFVSPPSRDLPAVAAEVRRRVDACTADLAHGYDRLIVELSGGLDSSVVASAVDQAGLAPKVAHWLNRAGDRPEGDESVYARAVTDRLGVPLTVVQKPMTPLTEADLAETAHWLWPGVHAADAARDRDEARRVSSSGVQALVSGDGGDAVFFQMPSALVWADLFQETGVRALTSPLLAEVARRTHQSVWGVFRETLTALQGRTPRLMPPCRFASRDVRMTSAPVLHAWVRDAEDRDLPPGKRLQINAIANCQVFRGESRRTQAADLLFPLLAQPVIELCLSIRSSDLASAAYDRPFERAAFADRLPAAVLQRRAKGNLGGYFSRLVAASLPTLRPYLLDGCLASAGVLDRQVLSDNLSRDRLLWGSRPNELLILAAVEAWVRHWQKYLPDSAQAPRGSAWRAAQDARLGN
jgi:asparagine synthase (glutamine-hydrolysing)